MKKIFVLVLAALFVMPAPTHAWWNNTHGALAGKVCADFGCPCAENITMWANIPDAVFKDTINHHDYNLSDVCPKSDEWKCPSKNDFRATLKMTQYLGSAEGKEGCERWKDIAVASHYFFDAKVFFHNVQDENYFKCHKAIEEKVDARFVAGDTFWEECACGVCVRYDEFEPWVREFEEKIFFEEKQADTPLTMKTNSNHILSIILSFLRRLLDSLL